jgi:protein TonB
MPVDSTTAEPSTTQAAAATSTESNSPVTETAQPSAPPVTAAAPDQASIQRTDYSWLQQAIFRRLEELKRSSRPSLDESRPLKVMVKAVVSREGALLNAAVVKSSGLDRIDQEAMALVQRAFPMQFDRTLDRQQVVMRIPITYSGE